MVSARLTYMIRKSVNFYQNFMKSAEPAKHMPHSGCESQCLRAVAPDDIFHKLYSKPHRRDLAGTADPSGGLSDSS